MKKHAAMHYDVTLSPFGPFVIMAYLHSMQLSKLLKACS